MEKPDRDGGIQRLAAGCLLPDWLDIYREGRHGASHLNLAAKVAWLLEAKS